MKIYQYTDSDGDRLYVGKVTGGGLMVTVEDSASRRSQVALTNAEAQKLYRELGQALGSDTPTVKPLTEERIREIAKEEARQVFILGSRRPA